MPSNGHASVHRVWGKHGMLSVWDMTEQQFKYELVQRTTPQLVYDHCKGDGVYHLLAGAFMQDCNDSVLREWTFQWASDRGGVEYDQIYNKWIGA